VPHPEHYKKHRFTWIEPSNENTSTFTNVNIPATGALDQSLFRSSHDLSTISIAHTIYSH
jgi:hypothetical protein